MCPSSLLITQKPDDSIQTGLGPGHGSTLPLQPKRLSHSRTLPLDQFARTSSQITLPPHSAFDSDVIIDPTRPVLDIVRLSKVFDSLLAELSPVQAPNQIQWPGKSQAVTRAFPPMDIATHTMEMETAVELWELHDVG